MPQLKSDYARSRVEQLLSAYYENELGIKVAQLFGVMRARVLNELNTYYDKDVMFKANMDLILAPIQELHKDYYDLLMKYKLREFEKSRFRAKRVVEQLTGFKRKGNVIKKMPVNIFKSDITDMLSVEFNREKLFGTLPISQEDLANRTYKLSEKTLIRVDADINNIIAQGYEDGWGIDKVTKDINKRFDQLQKWEAQRIARTEIHQSHNMGMMQGYQDVGVEYIQWNASIDSRTRDSHRDIHGEIIPMGALFSNGLHYPGDMGGPASEIINCRCVASPFIIPDGFIAPPGMVPFREEDLVATLDYWNQDELIQHAIYDAYDSQYAQDTLTDRIISHDEGISNLGGRLEWLQIELQRELWGETLENMRSSFFYALQEWTTDEGYNTINGEIYGTPEFREIVRWYTEDELLLLHEELEETRSMLDNIIDESPGLTQDTKFYRGGYLPEDAVAGGDYEFEGYTSLSYFKDSAFERGYDIEVYAPKGQKGVALENKITTNTGEHEYLLPRRQKYKVIYVDHVRNKAKIVLL